MAEQISRKAMAERVGSKLATYQGQVQQSVPTAGLALLRPERVARLVMIECGRSPTLLACTPESIVGGMLTAASLGLEIGAHAGEAYLVAFNATDQKTGNRIARAQLIIGYKGLVRLALRSPAVESIAAHVVREGDLFHCRLGSSPAIEHEPRDASEKATHYYAIAFLKGGGVAFDRPMTKADVEKIRKRSKAKNSGPWTTDFDEMARKTVVRRLCKLLPASAELAVAAEMEGAIEGGKAPPKLPELDWFDDGSIEGQAIENEEEPADAGATDSPDAQSAGASPAAREFEEARNGRK